MVLFAPLVEQPEVRSFEMDVAGCSHVSIKWVRLAKKGTFLPQHAHPHPHITFIASGAVRWWGDGLPATVYHAPAAFVVAAHQKHTAEALEDGTTICCFGDGLEMEA